MADTLIAAANTSVADKTCYTKAEVVNLTFNWNVKNVSFLLSEEELISSPEFFADAFNKIIWRMNMKASGMRVGVNLKLVSSNITNIKSIYKISLVRAEAPDLIIKDVITPSLISNIQSQKPKRGYNAYNDGYENDGSDGDLDDCSIIPTYSLDNIPDDELNIFCEIKFAVKAVHFTTSLNDVKVPKCKLIKDFGTLLENDKFCDVTLDVAGHEFPAHKDILSVRSSVFAAMFEHDMQENKSNRVTITDIRMEVVGELLRYIYTGEEPNLVEMADELLAAADKYDLEELKAMCEKSLCDELTTERAAQNLALADRHNAVQLKAKIIDFIRANSTEVMEMLCTSHAHLVREILSPVEKKEDIPEVTPLEKEDKPQ